MIDFIQGVRPMGRLEPVDDVQKLTGNAPRSFEQWASANLAAFA